MRNFHIFIFKIKRNFFSLILLFFIMALVLFSTNNIQGAKSGLKLWINSLVPSLFPFLVAVECLSYTNISKLFEKIFKNIMKPLFNISGSGSFALIMGWISRLPNWCKNCCRFEKKEYLY